MSDIINYFKGFDVGPYLKDKREIAFLLFIDNKGVMQKTRDIEGELGTVSINELLDEQKKYVAIVHTHHGGEVLSFVDLAIADENDINNMVLITKDKIICYEFDFSKLPEEYNLAEVIMRTPILTDTTENIQSLCSYIHEWFGVLLIGKEEIICLD